MVKRWQLGNGEMMEAFDASEPTYVLAADYDALEAALAARIKHETETHAELALSINEKNDRIAALEAELTKALGAFETIGYHLPKDNLKAVNEAICIARGFNAEHDAALTAADSPK